MSKRSPETIKLPDHQNITFAQGLQAGRQARPIIPSTGSVILIEALLQIVGGDKLIIPFC
ncbi:hypothetical protein AN664_0227880 [Serratia marcescens]|nr:hypothetical protein AN701_0227360 [Serratia marcescens]OCN53101.1 hypothetical protein AN658_0227250 [Serratia marcescens]OCN70756.1 hypothetical protein AN664_0227880 [Serratia marcescens]OCN73019.1 hypothetical protein AN665_0227150 [Serratia marcescens]OCO96666.1 hypothetical protein AN698_0226655 [Serratia marcescens]